MNTIQKLYMVLLGCKPEGRNIEQHDMFFGIAASPAELISQINIFWPEANGKFHIDVWREVTCVNAFPIEIVERSEVIATDNNLYFLNLGGYKPADFEEYHYKLLEVAPTIDIAISNAKKTAFYKHCGFKGAVSHIDDKYGIDINDMHKVSDIINSELKAKYQIKIGTRSENLPEDVWHIGYLTPKSFK